MATSRFIQYRKDANFFRSRRILRTFVVLCLGTICSGCVTRRFTIRSNPPGALVYVDGVELGTTPISANFTYYRTARIRLVKDHFETLTVLQPIPAPWYQWPPLDFVTENLIPGEIRDHREFLFQLQPMVNTRSEDLLSRAQGLRQQERSGLPIGAVPGSTTIPSGVSAGPSRLAPPENGPSLIPPRPAPRNLPVP